MLARIQDNHHIYIDQVTQGSEEALVRWFSVRSPNAFYRKNEMWDGWHRFYNVSKQRLNLPFLEELKLCCQTNSIPLEIADFRPAPTFPAPQPEQITETLLDGVTLEDYQVRALRACCNQEIGIVDATTGAGKTEIMCGLVKMFRCPTVVITEQIVVLNQIVERLKIRGVVHNDDIGLFCHGEMPDGNLVIVGSIQSVSTPGRPEKKNIKTPRASVLKRCREWAERRTADEQGGLLIYHIFPTVLADAILANPEGVSKLTGTYYNLLEEYYIEIEYQRMWKWFKTRMAKAREIQDAIKKCDLILVDEADLATSDQYNSMFRFFFNGRRRYGFSGTPFDSKKPVQNVTLKSNLGGIIFKTTRKEVQAAGRIIPIKATFIMIGPNQRDDARAFDVATKEEMVLNVDFHKLVATIPNSFQNEGTLILVDTSPIEPLGVALEQQIGNSKFIFGTTSQKKRDEYIDLFERRELTCLIGSKILKRGLDLKGGVENLVIIGTGTKWSDFDQKIGRAVRLNARGWARVFCFFFLNNKYLYDHSKESLKALVSLEYPVKLYYNGVEIDGEKFIRSNYRLPKPAG